MHLTLPGQLVLPGVNMAPSVESKPRANVHNALTWLPAPTYYDLARYRDMNLTDDDAYDLHRETYR
jgi:hypothetical protein